MPDKTGVDRSAIMRAVRAENTSPERAVRKILRAFAPGYRLHRKDLPGKPDIVYLRAKRAIFVHGCFWHGHACARGSRKPKSNEAYWTQKIAANLERDARSMAALDAMGWRVCIIWECELKDKALIEKRLRDFIAQPQQSPADATKTEPARIEKI